MMKAEEQGRGHITTRIIDAGIQMCCLSTVVLQKTFGNVFASSDLKHLKMVVSTVLVTGESC
jgi:hypothetical protein